MPASHLGRTVKGLGIMHLGHVVSMKTFSNTSAVKLLYSRSRTYNKVIFHY